MVLRKSLLIFPFLALAYLIASDKPIIKKTPATYTSPASGEEMYAAYCASCHGRDLKGNGPAALAMKTPPTDLTMLAVRNANEFPGLKVTGILRGQVELPSHGSKDMPVWGPILQSVCGGSRPGPELTLRIHNLTDYIKSFQVH